MCPHKSYMTGKQRVASMLFASSAAHVADRPSRPWQQNTVPRASLLAFARIVKLLLTGTAAQQPRHLHNEAIKLALVMLDPYPGIGCGWRWRRAGWAPAYPTVTPAAGSPLSRACIASQMSLGAEFDRILQCFAIFQAAHRAVTTLKARLLMA